MQLSFGLLVVIAGLLVKQPDFGQTALFGAVWLAQAVLAGMSVLVVGGVICLAVGGLGVAYLTSTHVAERIDHFVKGTGDTYQIDRALDCFKAGGLFGAGPGEGQMKFRLPEAHTDYIFSVIGEEFGAIACFMLAVLYLFIVVRVLLQLSTRRSRSSSSPPAGSPSSSGCRRRSTWRSTSPCCRRRA